MALDFPSSPTNGQVYGYYVYSSSKSAWQGREESASVAIVSPIVPGTPNAGDIWFNSTSGISYLYYNDGTSSQWVSIVSSAQNVGKVLQVVSATKNNVFSKTGTTEATIPDLSVTITPKMTNSSFLISANINISSSISSFTWLSLYRNSTQIGLGTGGTSQNKTFVSNIYNAVGTEMLPVAFSYLDSINSQAQTVYSVSINSDQASAVQKVNQRGTDTALGMISTITVMEIAQ
jgi:hypothetical protein